MLEPDPEHEETPKSETEAIQLSDLHAKLYVSENGWDAHIWTGSANATTRVSAERRISRRAGRSGKRFGIDALMEPQKGEVRFINLLEEADRFVASEPEESAVEALERRLEEIRESLATALLEAHVSKPTRKRSTSN